MWIGPVVDLLLDRPVVCEHRRDDEVCDSLSDRDCAVLSGLIGSVRGANLD